MQKMVDQMTSDFYVVEHHPLHSRAMKMLIILPFETKYSFLVNMRLITHNTQKLGSKCITIKLIIVLKLLQVLCFLPNGLLIFISHVLKLILIRYCLKTDLQRPVISK